VRGSRACQQALGAAGGEGHVPAVPSQLVAADGSWCRRPWQAARVHAAERPTQDVLEARLPRAQSSHLTYDAATGRVATLQAA